MSIRKTNQQISESNTRDAGRIQAMEDEVNAVINDKLINDDDKAERLKDLALEISNYKIAERLFDFYYEYGNNESLELYRRYYKTLKNTGFIEEHGQYFYTIPLKLFATRNVDQELLKIAPFVKIGDQKTDIATYLDFTSITSFTHKKIVEYFNELPDKSDIAKELNTDAYSLLSEELEKHIEELKQVRNFSSEDVKPYESNLNGNALEKYVAIEYIKHFEDVIENLNKQEIYKHDAAPIVIEFLIENNYEEFATDLFISLERTNDIEYYDYIKRIFECISWLDCAEEELDPIIYLKSFNLTNYAAPVHAEVLKRDVTTELEFDGKKMTIEEYLELSTKVHEMNQMLVGSLLIDNEARHAVATGTGTPTTVFNKQIEINKKIKEQSKN